MNTIDSATQDPEIMKDDVTFFPRGAVAFFASLIGFYAAFWLLLMFVLVSRG